MKTFLARAEEIFATAREGVGDDCEMAILIGRDGRLHFLPAAGWALEPLRREYGAEAAYRVERRDGRVRVEARTGEEYCCLLSAQTRPVAALVDFPQYCLSDRPAAA